MIFIFITVSIMIPIAGNFIGKGGAHADGTKSSGDKVRESTLRLYLVNC